jgi:hypothetical protein
MSRQPDWFGPGTLRSDVPAEKKRGRFFITGCQRSGTTLLRLVLECHPEIFCFDESRAYGALVAGYCDMPAGKRLAGFKIPRWTEALLQDPLVDVFLGVHVRGVYQGDPILFLYRDVRDTVASMLKLKITPELNWLERYGRMYVEQQMRPENLGRRYAREHALVRQLGNAAHAAAALIWKYKTQSYFDYRQRGWPVCLVSYDRLVSSPEAQLRRILAFLQLPWDPSLLDHHRLSHPEILEDGKTIGSTDPHRPISVDSVGQWQQLFQPQEVEEILTLAGDLNQKMQEEVDRQAGPGSR